MNMDKKEKESIEKAFKEYAKALNVLSKMVIWLAKRVLPYHVFDDFVEEFNLQAKGDDNG